MGDTEDLAEQDQREPVIPPGLKGLSAPLRKLVDCMGVDADLLAAAAQHSEAVEETPAS